MTATDELRRMLSERGVRHEDEFLKSNIPFYDGLEMTEWNGGLFGYVEMINHPPDTPPDAPDLTIHNCTPEQAIAATLGFPKAKAHPYGYEPDTGAFDATRCECGCVNDISATYCNDCGGEIEVDMDAEKEIYHCPRHPVFVEKHDDGSLEFCERRYIPEDAATLGKPMTDANLEQALSFMRIWISEDAHLGESELSAAFEKAEGLRKLDAIESAIAATLGDNGVARSNNGVTADEGGETRYHKLFGTPERAARTLVDPLICNCVHCDECGARAMCDVACSCPTANDAENALLEWLRSDAE